MAQDYLLRQTGPEVQAILDQVGVNTADIAEQEQTLGRHDTQIDKLNKKVTEIIGEDSTLTVTPESFSSETAILQISAETYSVFTELSVYVNDELVGHVENVSSYEAEHEVSETSTIRFEGEIDGQLFSEEKTVEKVVNHLTVGGGETWQEVEQQFPGVDIAHGQTGAITMNALVPTTGDKLFVVLKTDGSVSISSITMSGFPVPMEPVVEEDGRMIYESSNEYDAGTYPVTITVEQ